MRKITAICLAGLAATAAPAAAADALPRRAEADVYRPIRQFDFDERPQGNFEDLPAGWRRLSGPGLPLYSRGRLDDEVGRAAPPSFRFDLNGGNIAYEYAGDELVLTPDSDHLLTAWIRPEQLENAAAFVAIYLADAIGEPLFGTEQVSPLVRGKDWQRVEIPILVEHAAATAVRVQLWVLQDYVWRPLPPRATDPIIRQDVVGRAWFDDIGLYRMPRVRLRLSRGDGLVAPGVQEHLILEARGDPEAPWRAEIEILDEHGEQRWQEHRQLDQPRPLTGGEEVSPDAGPYRSAGTSREAAVEGFQIPLPPLEPGLYDAQVTIRADALTVVQRAVRFAVLPELPAAVSDTGLGIDLGLWRGGDAPSALAWLTELKAGAARIGLAVGADPMAEGSHDYYEGARRLARLLARRGVQVTGVLRLAGDDPIGPRLGVSGDWSARLGLLLMHLGPTLHSWQLGDEALELRSETNWSAERGAARLRELAPMIAQPQVVVPRDLWSAPPSKMLEISGAGQAQAAGTEAAVAAPPAEAAVPPGAAGAAGVAAEPSRSAAVAVAGDAPYVISYRVPAELPSSELPRALAFLQEADEQSAWLSLGLDGSLAELTRRIILSRAVAPVRLYVPAPMELAASGGVPAWQPTPEFIPLRTLLTALAGRRATRVLPLGAASTLIEFRGGSTATAFAWSRLAGGEEICLPAAAGLQVRDLWARAASIEWRADEACVRLGELPVLLTGFDVGPFLLERALSVEPTEFELSAPTVRPILRLVNPFEHEFRGRIELRLAPPWTLTPTELEFVLPPGGQREWPLALSFPTRPMAMQQWLRIRLTDTERVGMGRSFSIPLIAGLYGLSCTATAQLDGDLLRVEHVLSNGSERVVSFSTYCQVPGRPRREGLFIRVAPGQTSTQVYLLEGGEELRGAPVELGLQEIGGERRLHQLVEIPS